MLDVLPKVEAFFGWIEKEREEIDAIQNESFRRILLLTLLDTLAKSAFPEDNPGKRFVKLMDSYSGWQYKDRVSLIQLQYLLEGQEQAECIVLKNEIEMRLGEWPPKGIGSIPWSKTCDPLSNDLDSFKRGKCARLIEKARYAALLWQMRNFAVHELRIVGQALPDSYDFDEPYYSAYLNVETQQREWELNIPTIVISKLIESCSKQLRMHFADNKANPLVSFSDGLSWYPDIEQDS